MDHVSAVVVIDVCGYNLSVSDGMHQFHSKVTEGYSIVKYWSSSNLEIVGKILTELWHFLI